MSTNKTLLIFDTNLKMNTFRKVLGDANYEYVYTNGLLFDLPVNEFGIDITKNFTLKYVANPKSSTLISKLKRYKSHNIFIITSPSELGERLYFQLLRLLGLPLGSKKHICLPFLTEDLIKNFLTFAKKIDINLYYSAETRRVTERIGGHLITESLQVIKDKLDFDIHPHLGYVPAHLLLHLYSHVVNLHKKDLGFQLILETGSGFKAKEVIYNSKHDLNNLLPKLYKSEKQAIEHFQELKEFSSELTLIDESVEEEEIDLVNNLSLPQIAALLYKSSPIKQPYQLFHWLHALYDLGFISYFQPSNPSGLFHTLLEQMRTKFKDKSLQPYLYPSRFTQAEQESHTFILPNFNTNEDMLQGSILKFYNLIQNLAFTFFSQDLSVTKTLSLFKLQDSYFLGESSEENNIPPHAKESLNLIQEPQESDTFKLILYSLESLKEGISPKDLLTFTSCNTGKLSLALSLDQLLYEYKYLELSEQDNLLYLTEQGFICSEILSSYYSDHLNMDILTHLEKGIYAISQGKMSRERLLHGWFSDFKRIHEEVLKELPK